jgi:hypothetical protein
VDAFAGGQVEHPAGELAARGDQDVVGAGAAGGRGLFRP